MLDDLSFPEFSGNLQAQWLPIYIEPILGSGERLVIGVLAWHGSEIEVVQAPGLDRLKCLYDNDAQAVMYAATASIEDLRESLKNQKTISLEDYDPLFSSISFGPSRVNRGSSLSDVCEFGLKMCSSLQIGTSSALTAVAESSVQTLDGPASPSRVVQLVRQQVVQKRPGLGEAFHRPFQSTPKGRTTYIGFVGRKVIANFSVIRPSKISDSIRYAKTGLWDLNSHRDIKKMFDLANYEMLLQTPAKNDASISERQLGNIREAFEELEFEADRQEIRVRAMRNVEEMGSHILEKEAA